MGQIHAQCTFNFAKSKSKYLSKNRGKYKYKYFEKNSSTKYFEKFSQVQSSTSNATFMFHNGEGQIDENTKALLRIYSLFKSRYTILAFCIKS